MRTHSTPNQRTHWGFVSSEPAYCEDYANRGDPLAWWWQHHSDKPFLTGMALYVKERAGG